MVGRGRVAVRFLVVALAIAVAGPAASTLAKDTKPAKGPPKEWIPADGADARLKAARACDVAAKEAEKRRDRTAAAVLAAVKSALEGAPPPAAVRTGPDAIESAWLDHALEPAGPSATLLASSKNLDDLVAGQLVRQATQVVRGLRLLNACRRAAGVPELALDVSKSRGSILHCRYLVLNGYDVIRKKLGTPHDEGEGDPYATTEGREAALRSCLGQVPIDEGVTNVMATYYHRPVALVPAERSVAMGWWQQADKQAYGFWLCGDLDPDYAGPTTIVYPGADMTDVQTTFAAGGERPNPVPAADSDRLGLPITITVYGDGEIEDLHATLKARGAEIGCTPSSPAAPSNREAIAMLADRTMGLIPGAPLQPKTRYAVTARCTIHGEPWSLSWQFTTR
jgi:hypothetical protein